MEKPMYICTRTHARTHARTHTHTQVHTHSCGMPPTCAGCDHQLTKVKHICYLPWPILDPLVTLGQLFLQGGPCVPQHLLQRPSHYFLGLTEPGLKTHMHAQASYSLHIGLLSKNLMLAEHRPNCQPPHSSHEPTQTLILPL